MWDDLFQSTSHTYDINELIAIATDCCEGEIERELIFEQATSEYEEYEKEVEYLNFVMCHLVGSSVEVALPSANGFEMYVSRETNDGLKCYHVEYTPKGTKVFEIRPLKGEIMK